MPRRPLSHAERQGRAAADRAYDQTRRQTPALAEARHIRSSARWRKMRDLVLAKHPLCRDPYGVHAQTGRVELATQVDHIQALAVHPALAFEPSNLQGLCTACHARKSSEERRG